MPKSTARPKTEPRPKKLHFLAEWREFRGLSLRKMVQRMEWEPGEELISTTSLSRIEHQQQPLTPEVLHAAAQALGCAPEDIYAFNPLRRPELIDLVAVLRALPADKIETATRPLRAIA